MTPHNRQVPTWPDTHARAVLRVTFVAPSGGRSPAPIALNERDLRRSVVPVLRCAATTSAETPALTVGRSGREEPFERRAASSPEVETRVQTQARASCAPARSRSQRSGGSRARSPGRPRDAMRSRFGVLGPKQEPRAMRRIYRAPYSHAAATWSGDQTRKASQHARPVRLAVGNLGPGLRLLRTRQPLGFVLGDRARNIG